MEKQPKFVLPAKALVTLKLILSHPDNSFYVAVMMFIVCNGLRFVSMTLVVLFAYKSKSTFDILDALESLGFLTQGLAKSIPLIIFSKKVRKLINDLQYFWDTKSKFPFVDKLIGFNILSVYGLLLFIIFKEFPDKKGYFHSWIPDFPQAFNIIFSFQCFHVMYDGTVVIAVDSFFLVLCFLILDQFDQFKAKILEWDSEQNTYVLEKRMKTIIKHHTFLINYITTFGDLFSLVMLGQYVINAYCICIELFFVITGRDTMEMIYAVLCLLVLCAEALYFALLCEEISFQAEHLTWDIYNMHWYNYPVKIQKYYPLLLQATQRTFVFKAGNMFQMNREYLKNLFKGTFTLMTLATKFTSGSKK